MSILNNCSYKISSSNETPLQKITFPHSAITKTLSCRRIFLFSMWHHSCLKIKQLIRNPPDKNPIQSQESKPQSLQKPPQVQHIDFPGLNIETAPSVAPIRAFSSLHREPRDFPHRGRLVRTAPEREKKRQRPRALPRIPSFRSARGCPQTRAQFSAQSSAR